jgi:SAM-dependent methyltransferase
LSLQRPRTVAIIASEGSPLVRQLGPAIESTDLVPVVLPPTPAAAFGKAYRNAALGIVEGRAGMVGAAVARRLSRVPWIAVVDEASARWPGILAHANALAVAAADVGLIHASLTMRVTPLDDPQRLGRVFADLALAADARASAGKGALVADAWTFLDDRATTLAVRITRLTGKSEGPTHPKHLVQGRWNRWYLEELSPTDRLLDVGCGTGAHTVAAAGVVAAAVGVDIDAHQLEHARARARAAGLSKVTFVRGDLSDQNTLSALGTFDAVLLLDVLEHLADRRGTLEAIRSALRSHGRLLVTIPVRDTPYKLWRRRLGGFAYADPDHKIEYDEAGAQREFEDAGLSIVRIERAGYDSPLAGFSALLGSLWLGGYRRIAARRDRLGRERPQHAAALRIVATPAGTEAKASTG